MIFINLFFLFFNKGEEIKFFISNLEKNKPHEDPCPVNILTATTFCFAQRLVVSDLNKIIRSSEPTEVEDLLVEKGFNFESSEKKSGVKTFIFKSADGESSLQRDFSKDKSKDFLIIETKSEEWFEALKKNAKQAAYKPVKNEPGPLIHMDNRMFTFEFDPTKAGNGGLYRIKLYHSESKK